MDKQFYHWSYLMTQKQFREINNILKEIAKRIVADLKLNCDTGEAFFEDIDSDYTVLKYLDIYKEFLLNYKDLKESYIDDVFNEIGYLVSDMKGEE